MTDSDARETTEALRELLLPLDLSAETPAVPENKDGDEDTPTTENA